MTFWWRDIHVLGYGGCFSVQGRLINIGAETCLKWGRMPGRSLGEKCWGRGNGECKGPESGTCSLWFLILTHSSLSKISRFLISCTTFSHSKNLKFAACLSVVIFYMITLLPSHHAVLQDIPSCPLPPTLIFLKITFLIPEVIGVCGRAHGKPPKEHRTK